MRYEYTWDTSLFHNWVKDEQGNIDDLQYDVELDFWNSHNGPRCIDCGRTGCIHCEPDMYKEICPAKVNKNEFKQSN